MKTKCGAQAHNAEVGTCKRGATVVVVTSEGVRKPFCTLHAKRLGVASVVGQHFNSYYFGGLVTVEKA